MKILVCEKTCSKCGESWPLSGYHNDKSKPDGLHPQCKECHKARNHAYRTDPIRRAYLIERSRLWRKAHPEESRAGVRNSTLKWKYGISTVQYEEMLAAQGGACAICGGTETGVSWSTHLHVDHDHACCPGNVTCGRCVRGILCQPCNTSLGKMQESPEPLRRAAAYLEGGL